MKKILLVSMLATLIFAADGGYNKQNTYGGFTGPSVGAVNTVAAALKAWDDTMVTLTGKITRQVAREKYEFMDDTGTMIIEIDDDDWYGLSVGPNDVVQITGEVDSETFRRNEIDVKMIRKVNQ